MLFFSSFASQRVLGKSINKDPALFSLCGWGFRQANPSMTGLTISVGSEFSCEWHTCHTGPGAPEERGRTCKASGDLGLCGSIGRREEKTRVLVLTETNQIPEACGMVSRILAQSTASIVVGYQINQSAFKCWGPDIWLRSISWYRIP